MTDRPSHPASEADEETLAPELELALKQALSAAWHPGTIDTERHERLLQSCLEDPFAEPSPEELVESERLRKDLESESFAHPGADLARALKAAAEPALPSHAELDRAHAAVAPKRNVIYVAFGGIALMVAAAAALLVVVPRGDGFAESSAPAAASRVGDALAESRSTSALFEEPFSPGGTTSRVDRILAAREKELRENRYARWGVR